MTSGGSFDSHWDRATSADLPADVDNARDAVGIAGASAESSPAADVAGESAAVAVAVAVATAAAVTLLAADTAREADWAK